MLCEERCQYIEQVTALFPSLSQVTLPDRKTALPSSYPVCETSRSEHLAWAKAELALRVGYGHDLLEELRHAVGLYGYLIKKSKKARGVHGMKNASKKQSGASRKKGQIITDYIRNWARLSRLLAMGLIPAGEEKKVLQGLKKLDTRKDTKYFRDWGNQTGNYAGQPTVEVSWIWHVAMADLPSIPATPVNQETINHLVRSWESDGKN